MMKKKYYEEKEEALTELLNLFEANLMCKTNGGMKIQDKMMKYLRKLDKKNSKRLKDGL